ncbi:hypothetical protein ACFRAO_43015 [Streptomyces sp. NPDC056656]|uniref:hypothetical protein n=1 Tax=Streptomyces sp. NPDC056656 TaxID=3345895 RepID=UPI0036CB241A
MHLHCSRRTARLATLAILVLLVLTVTAVPSFAADGEEDGGLLGPFYVNGPEGVPIDRYELTGHAGGGAITDPITAAMNGALELIMTGAFALARILTGFSCWLVDWAYRFPIIDKLTGPAQDMSDAYRDSIVGPLGIAKLFLAWAFVFGLILIMRGRVARGAGEILLTLLIAALAATSLVRPDMLLGHDGPVQQTQRAALEAATLTTNGGDAHQTNDPCDLITGPAQTACRQQPNTPSTSGDSGDKDAQTKREAQCDAVAGPAHDVCVSGRRTPVAADVSEPITHTLTQVLVVQPYMLLEYGRVIDKDDPLYKVHKQAIDPPKIKNDPCDKIYGPAKKYCQRDDGVDGAAKKFKEHGAEGKSVAAYMEKATWDRAIGALLVLLAAAIIALVVISLTMALLLAQVGYVVCAITAVVVFAWAQLPGPNRGALWKWVGYNAASCVILFLVAVFIPLFGIAARVLLAEGDGPLVERLFLLDALAVAALAGHRIMLRRGRSIGQLIPQRMRYARIGGSHTMGDSAASTAAAFSSLGHQGAAMRGGSLSLGASPTHAALLGRHAQLAAGMRALGDADGMLGHPAGLLAEARAEAGRGLAPLALGLRAAHTALIGPKRIPKPVTPLGPDGRPLPTVIDGRTGRAISDGNDQSYLPIGSRLEEQLKRTRGGRVLVGTGKLAYYSTVGLPATWTRSRRATSTLSSDLSQEFGRQRAHYQRVGDQFTADTRSGLDDLTTPVRHSYQAVADPISNASRLRTWRETWLDESGNPAFFDGLTDDGHVRDEVWTRRFPWEPDPTDSRPDNP